MKEPIKLPVREVIVRNTAPGVWSADVTFGSTDAPERDDPTITISSGQGMELPPHIGDVLLVRPPEILGHAD